MLSCVVHIVTSGFKRVSEYLYGFKAEPKLLAFMRIAAHTVNTTYSSTLITHTHTKYT
jgi:hypothetical protein